MRRWLLLVVAALLLALATRYASPPGLSEDTAAIEALMGIAPIHLQKSVSGAELVDLEVRSDSTSKVQYAYDQLFDVVFVYRREGQTRTITAPYGLSGGSWITPTKVEMLSRDESALVVSEGD
jgi:hypothetical protein